MRWVIGLVAAVAVLAAWTGAPTEQRAAMSWHLPELHAAVSREVLEPAPLRPASAPAPAREVAAIEAAGGLACRTSGYSYGCNAP